MSLGDCCRHEGGDRQRRPGPPAVARAQTKLALADGQPLPRDGPQELHLGVVMGRGDVLDIPRPRREEYTIWTALAPDAIFTVRTYGTWQLYGPD